MYIEFKSISGSYPHQTTEQFKVRTIIIGPDLDGDRLLFQETAEPDGLPFVVEDEVCSHAHLQTRIQPANLINFDD